MIQKRAGFKIIHITQFMTNNGNLIWLALHIPGSKGNSHIIYVKFIRWLQYFTISVYQCTCIQVCISEWLESYHFLILYSLNARNHLAHMIKLVPYSAPQKIWTWSPSLKYRMRDTSCESDVQVCPILLLIVMKNNYYGIPTAFFHLGDAIPFIKNYAARLALSIWSLLVPTKFTLVGVNICFQKKDFCAQWRMFISHYISSKYYINTILQFSRVIPDQHLLWNGFDGCWWLLTFIILGVLWWCSISSFCFTII